MKLIKDTVVFLVGVAVTAAIIVGLFAGSAAVNIPFVSNLF